MKIIYFASGMCLCGKVKELRAYLAGLSKIDRPIIQMIKQKLN